jgi:hypothetical protein
MLGLASFREWDPEYRIALQRSHNAFAHELDAAEAFRGCPGTG